MSSKISATITGIIYAIIQLIIAFFNYKKSKMDTDKTDQIKKEKEERLDKTDEVCDKGKIEDLLNLKSFILISILGSCLGCNTLPPIEPTKPWENHYFNVEDFKTATQDITLEKNESIWVISNHTLKRLLKGIQK